MKYKAVIFDMDGTLLDTLEDIADSMNNVLRRFGYPLHPLEKYRYFIGDGIDKLVKRALPGNLRGTEIFERALADLREEYKRNWANKTKPYDGIERIIDLLYNRGIRLSILSNKPHDFTESMAKKLLPYEKFSIILGAREGVAKKPDPASAFEIAKFLGLSPEEIAYVGDTSVDMKMARAAGMFAIGAGWGFRSKEELIENGAHVVIAHPEELAEIILGEN